MFVWRILDVNVSLTDVMLNLWCTSTKTQHLIKINKSITIKYIFQDKNCLIDFITQIQRVLIEKKLILDQFHDDNLMSKWYPIKNRFGCNIILKNIHIKNMFLIQWKYQNMIKLLKKEGVDDANKPDEISSNERRWNRDKKRKK